MKKYREMTTSISSIAEPAVMVGEAVIKQAVV